MQQGLEIAESLWCTGFALEAGHIMFDLVPDHKRPSWAADILRCALHVIPDRSVEVTRVLEIAGDAMRWSEGHVVFDQVRRRVLAHDEDSKRRGWSSNRLKLAHLLSLAELVAKVTYNSSHPEDGFDEDSGWWIAVSLRNIVDLCHDPAFEHSAWQILTST